MKLDYKDSQPRPEKTKENHRSLNWKLPSALIAMVGACGLFFLPDTKETQASTVQAPIERDTPATLALASSQNIALPTAEQNSYTIALPLPERNADKPITTSSVQSPKTNTKAQKQAEQTIEDASDSETFVEHLAEWHSATVKSGDTLAHIAKREGIDGRQIYQLMQTGDAIKAITRIRPGEKINYQKDDETGELLALTYDINATERLVVSKISGDFIVSQVDRPFEIHQNRASGVINGSMYGAAKEAGLSDNVIMEMANIFGYDIDFALDVRKGDTFNVIWDEYYREGEKIKDGDVLAAEIVNNGRVVRAIRFTDSNDNTDYFTPDGKSLKKAFLRSPVHFTRISSKFNPNRLHPVFKTKRPHRGVDYAAKTGTPIYSAGDGKIIFRGKKRGYGNVVIVQHGNKYNTLYAHMSKFNGKARNGSRVKQGQTIGYVGQTGWATGPHLHYEFRVNGVHRNPLTVKLPTAQPLPKKHRKDFEAVSSPLLAQLDMLKRMQVAQLER